MEPSADRSSSKPVSSLELSTHATLIEEAEAAVAVKDEGALGGVEGGASVVALATLEQDELPLALTARTR